MTDIYSEIKKSQDESKKRRLWLQSMGFETFLEYLKYNLKKELRRGSDASAQ